MRSSPAVPDSLRQMIERQLETLRPDDRQALEVASVAGAEFSIAAVATALQADAEALDDRCEGLGVEGSLHPRRRRRGVARRDHQRPLPLRPRALSRRPLRARGGGAARPAAPAHRRAQGGCVRLARAARSPASWPRTSRRRATRAQAVSYHARAGDNAVARHADHEAIEHFTKALRQLASLPESPERRELDLALQVKLATPLMSTRGYAAPEVERVFERAHALSRQVDAAALTSSRCCAAWRRSTRSARSTGERAHVGRGAAGALREDRRPGGAGAGALRAGRHALRSGRARRARSSTSSERSRSTSPRPIRSTCPSTAATIPASPAGAGSGGCSGCAASPTRPCAASRTGSRWPSASGIRSRSTSRTSSAAMVRLFRWEIQPALSSSRARLGHLATRRASRTSAPSAPPLEGWACCMQGRPDDAIARLREALAGYEATGAAVARPSVRGLLAHAPAMTGRVDEASSTSPQGHRRRGADEPALPPGPAEPRPAATCCSGEATRRHEPR